MATKRVIGLLTVRDGTLVKSYGYESWRPAGRLRSALRNLDRWSVDEIVVLDISRRAGLDPRVLHEIAAAKVATPLAYGGGIRSVAEVGTLLGLGCDRFVLETLLFTDPAEVRRIADVTGRQALIGSLPLWLVEGEVRLWRPGGYEALSVRRSELHESPVSEFLVTSVPSQGRAGTFPAALLEHLDWLPNASVIVHGGLDWDGARAALAHRLGTAVALGNCLQERELVVADLRAALASVSGELLRSVRLS
jgi:cyclase